MARRTSELKILEILEQAKNNFSLRIHGVSFKNIEPQWMYFLYSLRTKYKIKDIRGSNRRNGNNIELRLKFSGSYMKKSAFR